jgi:hypothetical protein
MPANLEWQHRSIDNTYIRRAINQMIAINHTTKFLRHHSRSRDVVVVGAVGRLQPSSPLAIGSIGRNFRKTGQSLAGKEIRERRSVGD